MNLRTAAAANFEALAANAYPGRGIVAGLTPDGAHAVHVYWIMGRSDNSRNRIFEPLGDAVRTAAFDESRVSDPSLIIYNCVRITGRVHLVSNGDHTDTLHDAIRSGSTFAAAMHTRTFEPDPPNHTPRIAAATDLDPRHAFLQMAVAKSIDNDAALPTWCVYSFGNGIPGIGHFISTYRGDGNPLPSFAGEPQPMPLPAGIDATCATYWQALSAANRVALLVRYIDRQTGVTETRIVNRHVASRR